MVTKWKHPGGKLRELGAASLTDAEILAILISTGIKGKPAVDLARRAEALYLAAVLNAPTVDQLLKPMQSRGLWGPRDIHKKVLELPIPKFNGAVLAHQRLSDLGMKCSARVQEWVLTGGPGTIKSIGKLRSMVREMLKDKLSEIDGVVKEILV